MTTTDTESILTPEIVANVENRLLSDDPDDIVRALQGVIFDLGWNGDPSDSAVVAQVKKGKVIALIQAVEDGIEAGTITPRGSAEPSIRVKRQNSSPDEAELFGFKITDEILADTTVEETVEDRSDDKGFDADEDSDLSKY